MTNTKWADTLLAVQKQLEEDNMNDYAESMRLENLFDMRGMQDIHSVEPALSSVNSWGEAVQRDVPLKDKATNPSHYKNVDKKYEHRFVAKAWNLEYYLSAATKYIARCGKKPSVGMTTTEKEIQDLEKAIVYIQFRIEELQGE